jgi:hypothetical protein
MREIINRRDPVTTEVWDRDRAVKFYEANNEPYKVELIEAIPGDEPMRMYWHGHWQDLCRGPHLQHTGQVPADAFKLMSVAGRLLARRQRPPDAAAHLRRGFQNRDELKDYLTFLEEAEKRDHRRWAARWTCFTCRRKPRAGLLAPQRLDHLHRAAGLHAPPADDRRLCRGQHAAGGRPQAVGSLGPLGKVPGEHVHRRVDEEHAREKPSTRSSR